MFDLLIRDALLVDGSGAPAHRGNLAVNGDRIAAVGPSAATAPAVRTIDAAGQVLAPGFIDLHTHYDAQVFWDPYLTSSCWHGVTTVVIGNCGYTFAPSGEDGPAYLTALLAEVEEMPRALLEAVLPWSWRTFGDYLERLDSRLGLNVAAMVGHSAVRHAVMGEAAYERAATEAEIDAMAALVADAVRDGALGFSSSQSPTHLGGLGERVPSRLASAAELVRLAGALRAGRAGIVALTPASYLRGLTADDRALLRDLALASGRPVVWNSHAFRWEAPQLWRESAAFMAECATAGATVLGQTTCHLNEIEFDLAETIFLDPMPAWRRLMDLERGERLAAATDSAWRAALQADLDRYGPSGGGAPARRWDQVYLKHAGSPSRAYLVGQDLLTLGHQMHKSPAEVLIDLSVESDLRARFAYRTVAPAEEDEVGALLLDPHTVAGSSDAGAHLATHCNAGFVTILLQKWVRQKRTLTLEQGVHHLTGRPAAILGLTDRGLLRPGFKADLVLFDPERVGPAERETVHDLPGGGSRPIQRAQGIRLVAVNGKPILEDGAFTGALPGEVVKNSP